jgi:hypothetical protein
MRFVHWLAQNIVLVVFLIAVVGSFVISNKESASRDNEQRAQLITGCSRTSARTAFNAIGQFALAERVGRRNNPGDQKSSELYAAVGNGLLESIPLPDGMKMGDPAIYEAKLVVSMGKKPTFHLSDSAKALQKAGCAKAYAAR